jgi:hypothetical protein
MFSHFWRGRWPVIWAFVAVAVVFTAGWLVSGTVYGAWRFLGVPSMSPAFADLRTITHSIDCAAKGLDPYATGACDPWGRLYNYPSIWLKLGAIGISSASSDIIGALFIALLCATLLLIYDTRGVTSGVLAFAAVISPPALFAAERGNIDVLMFAASTMIFYLLAKQDDLRATLLLSGGIAFLAILKIYPIGGAALLVRRRLGFAGIALTGALTSGGLLCLSGLGELRTIASNTPQSTWLSYGDLPIFLIANNHGLLPAHPDIGTLRMIAAMTALAVAGTAILVSLRRPEMLNRVFPTFDPASAAGAVAMSGMAIFCASFVLGSNYDYRLVFLLGVLPVLLVAHDADRRLATMVAPATIVLFLWMSRISSLIPAPFEALDWLIFAAGVMWLTRSISQRERALAREPTGAAPA